MYFQHIFTHFDNHRITCCGNQSALNVFLILIPILMISQFFVRVG